MEKVSKEITEVRLLIEKLIFRYCKEDASKDREECRKIFGSEGNRTEN